MLLLWSLYALLLFGLHPFHVSLCEVYYNPRSQRVELVQRIFLDDLEEALRVYAQDPYLDVSRPIDPVAFDSLLEAYYVERLSLKINQKDRQLNYLGHRKKKTHMYSYMETDQKIRRSPRHLFIRNTILFEQFNDQQNLINIRIGPDKKSFTLRAQEPQQELSF